MTGAPGHRGVGWASAGLAAGTLVEAESGWRRVETLVRGDRIHTMDGALRPVQEVRQRAFIGNAAEAFPDGLVLVPGGALGNCGAFYLLPETHVLMTGEAVAALTGDSAALVRAADLAGHGGIVRALPVDGVTVVGLGFGEEEVIYANTGVMVHCPGPGMPRRRNLFPVAGAGLSNLLMACHFFEERLPRRRRPDAERKAQAAGATAVA